MYSEYFKRHLRTRLDSGDLSFDTYSCCDSNKVLAVAFVALDQSSYSPVIYDIYLLLFDSENKYEF